MGGKNARKNFSRKPRISRVINDGKKSSGKCAKTSFLKTHEYCDQKWVEKTRKKIFSRNRFRKQTTMEKNRLEKVRKHVFQKHTNIVTKKWGRKNARKNFSRNTRISRAKNDGKKIVWKK